MNITCVKCRNQQHFKVEVSGFKGYVCANCHSYYRGDTLENLLFVKKFEKPKQMQWPILGEEISLEGNNFSIITRIQRLSDDGEVSNEYVGLAGDDEELYLSDGQDYVCRLKPIAIDEIEIKASRLKFKGSNFEEEYVSNQIVVFAAGFVFEDLGNKSKAVTYSHTFNELKFVSYETFGNTVECYEGMYIDNSTYYNLFSSYSVLKERVNAASVKFSHITVFCFLLLGLIFYLFNARQFNTEIYNFEETFQGNSSVNQFVGKTFLLEGNVAKKLVLESISEVDKPNVNLTMLLVNEKTNESQSTVAFQHFFNDVNHASGTKIDFCNVLPGEYHIVFEAISPLDKTQMIKLTEDYKITYGGISYIPLIVFCVLLIALVLYVNYQFSDKNISFFSDKESFSYLDLIRFKYFGFGYLSIIIVFVFCMYYQQNIKNCNTTMKVNKLEDNTYTGSRSHYYRRTYNDYSGSHK